MLGFAHIETTPSASASSVPMTTLDALVKVHPRLLKTRLVKIDTEGYEPFILQGATEFLKQVRPLIICEVNSEWLKRFGWTPSKLHDLLTAQGYQPVASNGQATEIPELKNGFRTTPFSRTTSRSGTNRLNRGSPGSQVGAREHYAVSTQKFIQSEVVAWVGVALCFGGLLLLFLSLVSFGQSFRVGIDVDQPDKLVTTGIFAISRNPIYVGFALVLLGEFLVSPIRFC